MVGPILKRRGNCLGQGSEFQGAHIVRSPSGEMTLLPDNFIASLLHKRAIVVDELCAFPYFLAEQPPSVLTESAGDSPYREAR